jgi:hypothetical protein
LDGNPSERGETENGIARVDEVAIDDADTVGGMMRRCGNPANPRHNRQRHRGPIHGR